MTSCGTSITSLPGLARAMARERAISALLRTCATLSATRLHTQQRQHVIMLADVGQKARRGSDVTQEARAVMWVWSPPQTEMSVLPVLNAVFVVRPVVGALTSPLPPRTRHLQP